MTPTQSPAIIWFRRDLRLADNPALTQAIADGRPVVALFIRDPRVDAMGACPKWRLGLSIAQLQDDLAEIGGALTLRSGPALTVLQQVIAETGATEVHYTRDYTPQTIARDTEIKSTLQDAGLTVESHNGALLFEPWTVQNLSGSFFKVYTPFWKSVRDRPVAAPLPRPDRVNTIEIASETLSDWNFGHAMYRGAAVVADYAAVGERVALQRLDAFIAASADGYKADRDRMDMDATSRLSENLTYGEISPRVIWHAGQRALQSGARGAEHFLKELVWREFAYHLIKHTPHMLNRNWRDGWDRFPWRGDNPDAERWRRGQTGEPVIDAAMREMFVTGHMHNRARMVTASYLTKHLLTDWRVGMEWFAECLIDWDPASNAMGWQWVAGCGPDAAPFFRIFNPATQAEKFDPDSVYRDRFLGDPATNPEAAAYFRAAPPGWAKDINTDPVIDLKTGRQRALEAYQSMTQNSAELATG